MNILDRKWKDFPINQIFTISSSVRLTKGNMVRGTRPFIGASDTNNGITAFVANSNKSLDKNVLGVNYNGGVVENFYHPYEAIFSDDVKRLHLRNYCDNKYVLLFIKQCILKQKVKFEYGYKFNENRMNRSKIMLPVGSDDKPDYEFMETYMKEVENKLLEKATKFSDITVGDIKIPQNRNWGEFYLSKQSGGPFKIIATKSGIDKNKLIGSKEAYPYITRSDKDNGWDGFVSKQELSDGDSGNVITLGLDTQTVFYQPVPFYTGQNIQVLSHEKLNRHVALFLIPLIQLQMKSKFNWGGYGATLGRLHKMKIKLPITEDGKPDFQYMENYMRGIEAQQIKTYLDYKVRTA